MSEFSLSSRSLQQRPPKTHIPRHKESRTLQNLSLNTHSIPVHVPISLLRRAQSVWTTAAHPPHAHARAHAYVQANNNFRAAFARNAGNQRIGRKTRALSDARRGFHRRSSEQTKRLRKRKPQNYTHSGYSYPTFVHKQNLDARKTFLTFKL